MVDSLSGCVQTRVTLLWCEHWALSAQDGHSLGPELLHANYPHSQAQPCLWRLVALWHQHWRPDIPSLY